MATELRSPTLAWSSLVAALSLWGLLVLACYSFWDHPQWTLNPTLVVLHIGSMALLASVLLGLAFAGLEAYHSLKGWVVFLALTGLIVLFVVVTGPLAGKGDYYFFGIMLLIGYILVALLAAVSLSNAYFGFVRWRESPNVLRREFSEYSLSKRPRALTLGFGITSLTLVLVTLLIAQPNYDSQKGYDGPAAGLGGLVSPLAMLASMCWFAYLLPVPRTTKRVNFGCHLLVVVFGFVVVAVLANGLLLTIGMLAFFLVNIAALLYLAGPLVDLELRFLAGQSPLGRTR